jgi:hypothetical protein
MKKSELNRLRKILEDKAHSRLEGPFSSAAKVVISNSDSVKRAPRRRQDGQRGRGAVR